MRKYLLLPLIVLFQLICLPATAQETIDDFNGILWGAALSSLNNMEPNGDPALGAFIRKDESGEWNGISFDKAVYFFYKERFGKVEVTFSGKEVAQEIRRYNNTYFGFNFQKTLGEFCWTVGKVNIFLYPKDSGAVLKMTHADFMPDPPSCLAAFSSSTSEAPSISSFPKASGSSQGGGSGTGSPPR